MENKKKQKRYIILIMLLLVFATILLFGFTYAYFRTRVIGNTSEEQSIKAVMQKLEVTYSDDTSLIVADKIEPGYTATKTFSVENTGDEIVNYSIVLDNVDNNFKRIYDWTYTVKKGDTIIAEGNIPRSKTWIVNSVSIDSRVIDEYTIIINYANLTNIDQSIDMGSSLSFRVNIDEETGQVFESALEGSLLSAIAKDNDISEPLTTPGQSVILQNYKEYVPSTMYVNSYYQDCYWTYGTGYEYDSESKTYSLTGVSTCLYKECLTELVGKYLISKKGVNYNSQKTNEVIGSTSNLSEIYEIATTESSGLTYYSINATNMNILYPESLLAKTEDDYGESYYFRGAVENNYVNYSGMCWRIVRVQGNGTIKLVLADENNECNSSGYSPTNGLSSFINNGEEYYVSGPVLGSVVSYTSSWITRADKPLNAEMLENENANWCEDYTGESVDTSGCDGDDCWDSYYTHYGAYTRLVGSSAKPTLVCQTDIESGIIGALTADEVAFAGGALSQVSNYYLLTNATDKYWTTISPSDDGGNNAGGWYYDFTVSPNGELKNDYASQDAIRPAIILKSNVVINAGSGTQNNPYIVG